MSHHNSPDNFEIVHFKGGRGWFFRGPGWCVRRTCACHRGTIVSQRFNTQAEAERCLDALNADYHRHDAESAMHPPASECAA